MFLRDGDPLVRFRDRRDLEHVGERVVAGVVVDQLDAALLVVVKGCEARPVRFASNAPTASEHPYSPCASELDDLRPCAICEHSFAQ